LTGIKREGFVPGAASAGFRQLELLEVFGDVRRPAELVLDARAARRPRSGRRAR
jgi:hypothetical protein